MSRTASILCGALFLTLQVANVASAADPKVVVDEILGEAIPQLQDLLVSMSEGCSSGGHGVPPVNWGALQPHANDSEAVGRPSCVMIPVVISIACGTGVSL
jgi:hypothetical protein